MAYTIISNAELSVNNTLNISYMANTLAIDEGYVARDVQGLSGGAGSSDIAVSEDYSTAVGGLKVSLPSDPYHLQLVKDWQAIDVSAGLVITVADRASNTQYVFKNAIQVNKSEKNLKFQGTFDLEFKGAIMKSRIET